MKKVPRLKGTLYRSGSLFILAQKAAERSKEDRQETITAIILSVISFEAFINEFEDMLGKYVSEEDPVSLKMLKYFLRDLEKERANIKLKVQTILYVLTQDIPKKGKLPYQDFNFLIGLRNHLVHRKPEKFIWDFGDIDKEYNHHRFVKYLSDRKVIKKPKPGQPPSLSRYIECQEVAYWACNTVKAMINEIVSVVPKTTFYEILASHWREKPKKALAVDS
jgi:hypothetical protein